MLPVRVHTQPGAGIFVDGSQAGTASADGTLLISALSTGDHHLEARRKGKTAAVDLHLNPVPNQSPSTPALVEINFEKGPGLVTLQVDPADASVAVFNSKGEPVQVPGPHFGLAEGRYRFVARSNGYEDREEIVDVPADTPVNVNLKLSPVSVAADPPSLTGWEPSAWTADAKSRTLTHRQPDVGVYSADPSNGKFVFAGPVGRGFLMARPKVEWVVNYHDDANYLLFSLDNNSLEMFTVAKGKKTANGKRISFPQISRFQIMQQIEPGHIITWIGIVSITGNSQGWKQLSDWAGLPDDIVAGKFGFKGPVTLTSFTHIR
jgi:serine/threonine-protein kinase